MRKSFKRARLALIPLAGLGAVWSTTDWVERGADAVAGTPDPAASDAIVVFTGDDNRIITALEVANRKQKVFISGAEPRVTLRHILRGLHNHKHAVNADPANIILGYAAMDTAGNAKETVAWLAKNPQIKNITVVTSRLHVLRARYELKRLLPPNIEVHFLGAPSSRISTGFVFEERQKYLCAAWSFGLCRESYSLNSDSKNLRNVRTLAPTYPSETVHLREPS